MSSVRNSSYRRRLLRKFVTGCSIALCNIFLVSLSGSNETLNSSSYSDNEAQDYRQLSIDNGDGTCKWMPPKYEVPDFIDFYKTIIVGYPSGDKRLAYMQMEALTGWSAKDEWDFEFLGMSNHPFIKANYPHHEGKWVWNDAGDQVLMIVRDMRTSMAEYHDILWDINYSDNRADTFARIPYLYAAKPPLEKFLEWRDLRVMDEIHWYGWFIDYWMEAGLLRDVFTHNITTKHHWDLLMHSADLSKKGVKYEKIVGNTTVTPVYDANCEDKVSGGCHPVQVISAERLLLNGTGPIENRKIAMSVRNKAGIGEYLIDESVWECIWTELVVHRKGYKTFIDREGINEREYNFSDEMLSEMLKELDRLIEKYSSDIEPDFWHSKQTAKDLVDMLSEHRASIQAELGEVESGHRRLMEDDFLGPIERTKRRVAKLAKILMEKGEEAYRREMQADEEDYSKFFNELDGKLLQQRVNDHRKEVLEAAKRRKKQTSST